MAKNTANDTLERRLGNVINETQKQVKSMRTNPNWKGWVPLPVRTTDPAVTGSGQYGLYYNSGTGKVRKSYNGSAWSDTTI